MKEYPIIDNHISWTAVNSIQGCPKNCQYCFLKDDGFNLIKPKELVTEKESLEMLLNYNLYLENIPVCLFPNTDIFSTNSNIEYLTNFLKEVENNNVKNYFVIITKCKIPESFLEEIKRMKVNLIFILSYSGLESNVEIGINKKDIENNFILLRRYNQKTMHYWRPFIPENSTEERMFEVYNFVKKYSFASIATGLKVTSSVLRNIKWDQLKEIEEKALKAPSVYEKYAYKFLWEKTKNSEDDYPIFHIPPCAIASLIEEPEYMSFYNSFVCKENKCSKAQRKRCELLHKNKNISKELIYDLIINKINKNIELNNIIIKDNDVILKHIELKLSEISFLTYKTNMNIKVEREKNDYYAISLMEGADILKL